MEEQNDECRTACVLEIVLSYFELKGVATPVITARS